MYGYRETAADFQTNLKIKKKPEISQAFHLDITNRRLSRMLQLLRHQLSHKGHGQTE